MFWILIFRKNLKPPLMFCSVPSRPLLHPHPPAPSLPWRGFVLSDISARQTFHISQFSWLRNWKIARNTNFCCLSDVYLAVHCLLASAWRHRERTLYSDPAWPPCPSILCSFTFWSARDHPAPAPTPASCLFIQTCLLLSRPPGPLIVQC